MCLESLFELLKPGLIPEALIKGKFVSKKTWKAC